MLSWSHFSGFALAQPKKKAKLVGGCFTEEIFNFNLSRHNSLRSDKCRLAVVSVKNFTLLRIGPRLFLLFVDIGKWRNSKYSLNLLGVRGWNPWQRSLWIRDCNNLKKIYWFLWPEIFTQIIYNLFWTASVFLFFGSFLFFCLRHTKEKKWTY